MADTDLKCAHCHEDPDDYGNWVDAVFVFDGQSLCSKHYWQHRDKKMEELRRGKEEKRFDG